MARSQQFWKFSDRGIGGLNAGQFEKTASAALHLACAEQGGVDVFLTTDDDVLHRARQ